MRFGKKIGLVDFLFILKYHIWGKYLSYCTNMNGNVSNDCIILFIQNVFVSLTEGNTQILFPMPSQCSRNFAKTRGGDD